MKREDLKKTALPDAPGAYLFKKGRRVLYIGKATSLRDRVRSYFSGDLYQSRGPLVENMVADAETVDFIKTDSALEALILEANLIKKYQPKANTFGKDDKTYNYVVISREDFPRVFLVRGQELSTKYDPDEFLAIYGPYPHGGQLQEALNIIRRIFPFRGEKDAVRKRRQRSVLNEQLGLTPAFVTKGVSQKDYARTIRNVRLFFEGKKGQLVKKIERDMKAFARRQEFEHASDAKRQLFALRHIKDVSLIKKEKDLSAPESGFRIEAYDIAHTSGEERVGVMTVVEGGVILKSEYRKFNIKEGSKGDTGALREVLSRRLSHDDWHLPKLIVMDGSTAQLNVARGVLLEYGYKIPVVSVVKNERHKPKGYLGAKRYVKDHEDSILLANSEAHRFALSFHRRKRSSRIKR